MLDTENITHFYRTEDIRGAELHDDREKEFLDKEGKPTLKYYGFIKLAVQPFFVWLGKEGVTLALEQLEKLKAAEIAES